MKLIHNDIVYHLVWKENENMIHKIRKKLSSKKIIFLDKNHHFISINKTVEMPNDIHIDVLQLFFDHLNGKTKFQMLDEQFKLIHTLSKYVDCENYFMKLIDYINEESCDISSFVSLPNREEVYLNLSYVKCPIKHELGQRFLTKWISKNNNNLDKFGDDNYKIIYYDSVSERDLHKFVAKDKGKLIFEIRWFPVDILLYKTVNYIIEIVDNSEEYYKIMLNDVNGNFKQMEFVNFEKNKKVDFDCLKLNVLYSVKYDNIGKISNISSEIFNFDFKNGELKSFTNKTGEFLVEFFKFPNEVKLFKTKQIKAELFENGNIRLIEKYNGVNKDGISWTFFENGKISKIRKYSNNLQTGYGTIFHDNGNIKEIAYFNNGKIDNKYKSFYSNGKLRVSTNFKNGIYDGHYIEYFESGNLKIKSFYKDDKLNGRLCEKYDNGIIKMDCEYLDDEPVRKDGDIIILNKDASIHKILTFVDYSLVRSNFMFNDKSRTVTTYRDGKKENVIEYDKNGIIDSEIEVGKYVKLYYTNGKIRLHQMIDKNSIINGKSIEWYQNGKMKEVKFIKNEKVNGKLKRYHEDTGLLKEILTFENGIKHGLHEVYSNNGQIIYRENFINNKLNGYVLTFDDNENVESEILYINGHRETSSSDDVNQIE